MTLVTKVCSFVSPFTILEVDNQIYGKVKVKNSSPGGISLGKAMKDLYFAA